MRRVRVYAAKLPGGWGTVDLDDWLRTEVAILMLDIEAVSDFAELGELLFGIFPGLDIKWESMAGPTLEDFDKPHWLPCQCCHVVLLFCDYDTQIYLLNPESPCWLPRDFEGDTGVTSVGHSLIKFCPDLCKEFAAETVQACTLVP